DIVGRAFIELIAPEDYPLFRERKTRLRADGRSVEVTLRFICSDSRVMDVLILERELGTSSDPTGSLNVMTDVTELRQSEKRNRQQAITDHLTGLVNRQGFEAILDGRISDADRMGTPLACLFVDLDRFKSVNDNLGHAA